MHFSFNVCFIFSLLSFPLSYALTFPLSVPGIFSSACNVDVRWFPFDVQHCELKFGSWTFDGWLLDLQMQEADLSGYMSNGEWELLGERALSAPDPLVSLSPPYYFLISHFLFPPPSCRCTR